MPCHVWPHFCRRRLLVAAGATIPSSFAPSLRTPLIWGLNPKLVIESVAYVSCIYLSVSKPNIIGNDDVAWDDEMHKPGWSLKVVGRWSFALRRTDSETEEWRSSSFYRTSISNSFTCLESDHQLCTGRKFSWYYSKLKHLGSRAAEPSRTRSETQHSVICRVRISRIVLHQNIIFRSKMKKYLGREHHQRRVLPTIPLIPIESWPRAAPSVIFTDNAAFED